MKKRILVFFLAFVLAVLPVVSVQASGFYVRDEVGTLFPEEIEEINGELSRISDLYDFDILIAVVNEMAYSSPRESAEAYYAANATRPDGIVLLLGMFDRSYCIKSTPGRGEEVFSNYGCDYLFDSISYDLGNDDYASAFLEFARQCEDFLWEAENGTPYSPDNQPRGPIYIPILISLGVAVVVAFITVTVMKSKLKTVRPAQDADLYIIKDSFYVSTKRDIFLHRNVTRTAKPKASSSSGGSSGGGGGGGGGCSSGHF